MPKGHGALGPHTLIVLRGRDSSTNWITKASKAAAGMIAGPALPVVQAGLAGLNLKAYAALSCKKKLAIL